MYSLDCSYNKLKELDLDGLYELEVLICNHNKLNMAEMKYVYEGMIVR
ncbi:MAG: hypothetical protein HFG30_07175 [Eubacterium sp.]|nr:hypothetical protein [Eubacterium sp.]